MPSLRDFFAFFFCNEITKKCAMVHLTQKLQFWQSFLKISQKIINFENKSTQTFCYSNVKIY